jgi:hypothetical protein
MFFVHRDVAHGDTQSTKMRGELGRRHGSGPGRAMLWAVGDCIVSQQVPVKLRAVILFEHDEATARPINQQSESRCVTHPYQRLRYQ